MDKSGTIQRLRTLMEEMVSRERLDDAEALRTALDELQFVERWSNAFPDTRSTTDDWAQRADVLWGTVRRWMVNRVYTPEDIRAFYKRQYGCKEGADRRIALMVRLFQDYLAAFAPESDAVPAGNATE